MNVLIVHPCKGFYGGAEEVVRQLSLYLVNQGIDVFVVTKDAPNELKELFEVRGTRLIGADATDWIDFWRYTRTWMKWANVVNVHNAPAPLMTFPKKVPTVYMCNEPMELFTNWKRKPIEAFNRWWVKKSGMEVVVADSFNARRFKKMYDVIPNIIPYGVDYGFWSESVAKRDARFTVLQVGHQEFFDRGKKIFAELQKELPEARLVQLVGKEHKVVRTWYNRAHVLIHPIKSQGGWLVPFEALCAGLPIIVSQEFTGRDVILENKLGMIATDFGEMVKYTHENLSEIRQIVPIQKGWVRNNLTWQKFGESMTKVFEEATK